MTGSSPPAGRRLSTAVVLAWPGLALAGLVAGGLALRLRDAWASLDVLLLRVTPDDTYYYLQIARNVANGRNATFDGETLTNGFHPLWLVLLTPVYLATDDRELALHVALTLGALLGAATIVMVYAIVKLLTGNVRAALVAGAFYAVHPYLVFQSVNGMETALTVFLFSVTVWLFLRIVRLDRPATLRDYAWLGVASGLMVLARTDMVFVIPPLLLFLVAWERGRRRWLSAGMVGGLALLVVGPWLVWSLVSFGTVVQVSGVAIPQTFRDQFLAAHGDAVTTQLRQAWDVTEDAFSQKLVHEYLVPRNDPRAPVLIGLGALFALMVFAPLAPHRRRALRQLGLLAVPSVGVVSALLFHTAVRWHTREWYYAPAGLVIALLLGIAVSYLDGLLSSGVGAARRARVGSLPAPPRLPRALGAAALYGGLAVALALVYSPRAGHEWVVRLPHRLNVLEAARWLESSTEPDATVGAFNAGILGYFSGRDVVNLDGVVNEDAYDAGRDGRLLEYMCAKIGYLVDVQIADYWAGVSCRPDTRLSFQPVVRLGRVLGYSRGGQMDILELRRAAAAPQEAGASAAQ